MTTFARPGSDLDHLLSDLRDIIRLGNEEMPRGQQKDLGPSEIGDPCARKLAFKIMDAPACNTHRDPLAALMGTAFHSWFAWAVDRANTRLGRIRWVSEQRVTPRPGGGSAGTCDLFDLDTLTVIDLKCPGPTRFSHYVKHGPSLTYRRQVHIYGYGYWRTFGLMPARVAIYWVGRASTLERSQLWWEPFDPAIAEDTFTRYDNLALTLDGLDIERHPERFALIPAEPSDDCGFCDWWSPKPGSPYQCPGHTGGAPPEKPRSTP